MFVGDTAASSGTVILHRVSSNQQGEIDSTRVASDGTFSFRLPGVPDPGQSDVYFASVRHSGILYFGSPINTAVQLDSLYEIHAYDTETAPATGTTLPVQVRNLFLEANGDRWQVTDLFQVRNDSPHTLVAADGGYIWRYPLPPGAADAEAADSEFSSGAVTVDGGYLVLRTPLPPGERLFVVRYMEQEPFFQIPLPGSTESLEVLIKEPAPPIDVPGMTATDRIELEPGTTYRRYSATDLKDTQIELKRGREPGAPPVKWFAVILGLSLGAVAVWAIQKGRAGKPRAAPATPQGRRGLILEVARLDQAFEANPSPTPEERGAYEARRAELLRRIQHLS